MTKFIALFVLTAALGGCASSSPFGALTSAPAARVSPAASPYAQPNLPQSQYECVTDEGYGRWQPCGNQS